MKKIFNRLKKVNPNHLILFNIIFIMVVFGGINKYNNKKYPVKSEKKIDGIKYTVLINRHKYSKDSLMLINLNIQNSGRKKKEIEIKRENIFNVEIYSNDKLIYKRDFMDKLSGKTKILRIGGYAKIVSGCEWNLIPNGEVEDIEYGKYLLRVYSKDLKIDMKIPFEISKEGL